jgi:hypothetical protein
MFQETARLLESKQETFDLRPQLQISTTFRVEQSDPFFRTF